MPKPKQSKPVTAAEVEKVVLQAILREFDGRQLDESVARQGLALAAHTLIQMHMGALGKKA